MKLGTFVKHPTKKEWGIGKIINIFTDYDGEKITVKFKDKASAVTLIQKPEYTKLIIVEKSELSVGINRPAFKSYDDIRRNYGKDYDKHADLKSGRKILQDDEECAQYLHSYGPMVQKQGDHVYEFFNNLNFLSPTYPTQIIDYACGQGGASTLFLDKFYQDYKAAITKIKLIEPSSAAIKKAKIYLKEYSSDIQMEFINKNFNSLDSKELEFDERSLKIHLFSNILDIENISSDLLLSKILENKGKHLFLAFGNDRGIEGGTPLFENFYNKLDNLEYNKKTIPPTRFEFSGSTRPMKAIFFIAYVEVS